MSKLSTTHEYGCRKWLISIRTVASNAQLAGVQCLRLFNDTPTGIGVHHLQEFHTLCVCTSQHECFCSLPFDKAKNGLQPQEIQLLPLVQLVLQQNSASEGSEISMITFSNPRYWYKTTQHCTKVVCRRMLCHRTLETSAAFSFKDKDTFQYHVSTGWAVALEPRGYWMGCST